jgi:hypothetical protein
MRTLKSDRHSLRGQDSAVKMSDKADFSDATLSEIVLFVTKKKL